MTGRQRQKANLAKEDVVTQGLWGAGSKAQQVPPVLGHWGTLLISWACGARPGGGLGRGTTWNHLVPSLLTMKADDMGRWGRWAKDSLLDRVYLNLLGGKVQVPGSGAGPNISTAWWDELVFQDRSTKRLAEARALLLEALAGCCSGHHPPNLLYLQSSRLPPPHFSHRQSGARANYSSWNGAASLGLTSVSKAPKHERCLRKQSIVITNNYKN